MPEWSSRIKGHPDSKRSLLNSPVKQKYTALSIDNSHIKGKYVILL